VGVLPFPSHPAGQGQAAGATAVPISLLWAGYFLNKERSVGSCLAKSLSGVVSGLPAELFGGLLSLKEQGKTGRLCVNKFWWFSFKAAFPQPSV